MSILNNFRRRPAPRPIAPQAPQGGGDGGDDNQSQQNNVSIGRLVLLLALLAVAGYLVYQAYFGDEVTGNKIPRAMQLTYKPSDFRPSLDDENTLRILSDPQRYKNDFDQLILNFNSSLLMHVAGRMGLGESQKQACLNEYRKQHPYIRQMYFNDFISLRDSNSVLYETWYENETSSAVDLLNEVASKYTCFFLTQILSTVLQTQEGKLAVRGSRVETPCGIALTEGLRPTITRLQKFAAVNDFSKAKGLMKERVERTIAELAVVEVRDRKGIRKQFDKKVAGYTVSSTEIELSAMSVAKIGFNLNQYFDISVNSAQQVVTATLPQPIILSHEVYPKLEAVDVGFWAGLTEDDFNRNINILRQAFRADLDKSDIFNKAQVKASELMKTMLEPMVQGINKGYKLQIRFLQPQSPDYNMPKQPQSSPQQRPALPKEVQKPKQNFGE